MFRRSLFRAAVLFVTACGLSPGAAAQLKGIRLAEPVEWVNPLMGSASKPAYSNGNTYPAVAMPWGMNFWVPQTGKMGNGWVYSYDAEKIRGFKQTHQPSPWMNDYGQFSIMPFSGKIKIDEDERASWFSHKTEIAKPYYYRVYLADHHVQTEIAPTERAASFRFSFAATDTAMILVDAFDKGSYIKVLPEERTIIGYTTKNSGGVPANFKNFFIIRFDKDFFSSAVWSGKTLLESSNELTGDHVGAVVGFSLKNGRQVHAKVASSFISMEQARLNLKEVDGDDFETTKARAKAAWNHELSRISISGGSPDQLETFYSCLYRCLLFPRKFFEIDAVGKVVHYSPYNGKTEAGYMFTDTGFWDTFRALFPFINLMYPSLNSQIQEGLLNAYKEGGWLPEWASPGYRDIMIGSNSASVVAEAYLKGCRGYDIDTLYQALLKNAGQEGPLSAVGRKGAAYYNALGYVPYDVGIKENAARTLEYAYDDFALYQLAKALKRPVAEIDRFAESCQNYQKLYDPATRLMRGRNADGSFQKPFNPFKWGDSFTEGNSWHYTWSVFHDIAGLIDLMGGNDNFIRKLDSVFALPPVFDAGYYRSVIHEIREMQTAGMGQYAHGNQPIQHMTYLYNYAGAPWKSQYWVRETLNRMYRPGPDGYCGDEDNGQTSAWYVFSALGFYPVTPASDQYVIGSPLFRRVQIQLENGKRLLIKARKNSGRNRYIAAVRFNGKDYSRNWFSHRALMRGATIRFKMSAAPDFKRGTADPDAPFSFSRTNGKEARK